MKKYYDADYIIREISRAEDQRIYNSPVEVKLRKMIKENNRLLKIQNEKCRQQKAKLEEKKRLREQAKQNADSEQGEAMGM